MCIRVARNDAQRKYPLDDKESAVMDVYLRERVEVRKWTGSYSEHKVMPIIWMFEVQ
jgi:hypothetical protein